MCCFGHNKIINSTVIMLPFLSALEILAPVTVLMAGCCCSQEISLVEWRAVSLPTQNRAGGVWQEYIAFPAGSEAWHWALHTLDLHCLLNAKSIGKFNSLFGKAWIRGGNNILSVIHQVRNYGKLSFTVFQNEIYPKLSVRIC